MPTAPATELEAGKRVIKAGKSQQFILFYFF